MERNAVRRLVRQLEIRVEYRESISMDRSKAQLQLSTNETRRFKRGFLTTLLSGLISSITVVCFIRYLR